MSKEIHKILKDMIRNGELISLGHVRPSDKKEKQKAKECVMSESAVKENYKMLIDMVKEGWLLYSKKPIFKDRNLRVKDIKILGRSNIVPGDPEYRGLKHPRRAELIMGFDGSVGGGNIFTKVINSEFKIILDLEHKVIYNGTEMNAFGVEKWGIATISTRFGTCGFFIVGYPFRKNRKNIEKKSGLSIHAHYLFEQIKDDLDPGLRDVLKEALQKVSKDYNHY
jgi:hypothetical protein